MEDGDVVQNVGVFAWTVKCRGVKRIPQTMRVQEKKSRRK